MGTATNKLHILYNVGPVMPVTSNMPVSEGSIGPVMPGSSNSNVAEGSIGPVMTRCPCLMPVAMAIILLFDTMMLLIGTLLTYCALPWATDLCQTGISLQSVVFFCFI